MEPSAIERDLDELETRLERLRALYEQYFIGIEKLEPHIPRKEVERRMQLLRKEQIRNTALRFKFQMLIQRYNTLQQYWARVAREIENGTYRRDVMRAAARFGAKEAVTILGKQRADRYAALAEAQAQRKAGTQRGDQEEEEEVELDADDLIIDEDTSQSEEDKFDHPHALLPLVTAEPAQPVAPPRPSAVGVMPLPAPRAGSSPSLVVTPLPAPQAGYSPSLIVTPLPPLPAPPTAPSLGGLRWEASPRRPSTLPQPPSAPLDHNLAPPAQPSAKAAVLSPSASPDPRSATRSAEALAEEGLLRTGAKRRVTELAAAVRTPPGQGAASGANASLRALDLDLEEAHRVGQAVAAPPQRSPPAELRGQPNPAAVMGRVSKSPTSAESAPRLGSQNALPVSVAAAAQPARSPLPAARDRAPTPEMASAVRPQAAAPPAAASADSGLSEQRIRQIYAKYVETKRKENESTAGVTYDKLAATLRAQAQRLGASHPTKTVDYEVVVKDGKTQLKPILR